MRSLLPHLLLPVVGLAALTGCSPMRASCFDDLTYLQAHERPRLQMPEGVAASERITPVVIPPVAPDAAKLDPQPRCIDNPPSYFGKKGPPAATPSASQPPAPATSAAPSAAPPEPPIPAAPAAPPPAEKN
ncbi:MAG TPA: hypothetical protein VMT50_08765 [Steroidobacteraceae bacterium]|nr:hypothetical protein [Steroidobacteraceae bacterium]